MIELVCAWTATLRNGALSICRIGSTPSRRRAVVCTLHAAIDAACYTSTSQRTSSGTCCSRDCARILLVYPSPSSLLQPYEPVSEHTPPTCTAASPISASHHVGHDGPKASRWMMGIGSPRRRSPGAHHPKARTAQCYRSQLNLAGNPEFQADGSPCSVLRMPLA